MSIDQRLRAGLHRSADAIGLDVAGALHAVEQAAGRRRRNVRIARLAVAAAAAAAVAIAGIPAVDRLLGPGRSIPGAEPSMVVGTYVVDIADSEPARQAGMTGRWVVTLRPDGVVHLIPPDTFPGNTAGASYSIDGDLLRTDAFLTSPGCQRSNDLVATYRWVRTPSTLRFTVVAESCVARRVLFADQPWEVSR